MTTPGCKRLYPALRARRSCRGFFFFFYSSAAPAEVGVGGGGGGGGAGGCQPSGRQPREKQPNRVRSGAEEEEAWQEVALGSRVHLGERGGSEAPY